MCVPTLVAMACVLPLAVANDNGLARTPPMGWRSWNFMREGVTQEKILGQMQALVARRHGQPSLLDRGYNHIGIDDGWQACGKGIQHSFHDGMGMPIIDTSADKFPDMKSMNVQAHANGVKMGWYGNNCGCSERAQFACGGAYSCKASSCDSEDCGHVRQDSRAAADLGFDSIKIDGCGPSSNISAWAVALNATGRKILLEDCLTKQYTWNKLREFNWTQHSVHLKEVLEQCPGHFLRLGDDIAPQFMGTMYNMIWTYQKALPYGNFTHPVSRPGCWIYPDMLEVGVSSWEYPPSVSPAEHYGLSMVESRTHFAAWVITSAPLILGFDLTNTSIYDQMYPIITNKLAIAINQQWAGSPGVLVSNSSEYHEYLTEHAVDGGFLPEQRTNRYPTWQVWRKPLLTPSNGQAVLIINLSEKEQDVSIHYNDIDPSGALGSVVEATDVWTGTVLHLPEKVAVFKGIKSHDSVFIVLCPVTGAQMHI